MSNGTHPVMESQLGLPIHEHAHLDFLAKNSHFEPRLNIPEKFDFNWVMYQSRWPWLELDLHVPHEAMFTEAMSLQTQYCAHRYSDRHHGYRHEGWYSLCVHGLGAQKTESFHAYGFSSEEEAGYQWTEIAPQCPATIAFVKSLPFEKLNRVRFMLLAPGGYIHPHRDQNDHSFYPINIAINHPQDCHFAMEGMGLVPFQPGKAFLMNLAYTHSVYNGSNFPRIHMIVHGHPGDRYDEYGKLVRKSFDQLKRRHEIC